MVVFDDVPDAEAYELILQGLRSEGFRYAHRSHWRQALGEFVTGCGRTYSEHLLTKLLKQCLVHYAEIGVMVKDDGAEFYFMLEDNVIKQPTS